MKTDWINIPQIEEETHEEIGSIKIFVTINKDEFDEPPYFTITHYKINNDRLSFGRLPPLDNFVEAAANKYWHADRLDEIVNNDDAFEDHRMNLRIDAQRRRSEYREQVL